MSDVMDQHKSLLIILFTKAWLAILALAVCMFIIASGFVLLVSWLASFGQLIYWTFFLLVVPTVGAIAVTLNHVRNREKSQ